MRSVAINNKRLRGNAFFFLSLSSRGFVLWSWLAWFFGCLTYSPRFGVAFAVFVVGERKKKIERKVDDMIYYGR